MYFYRCTEQQLGDALKSIDESGDLLLHVVYKGGRDYVLICRKVDATLSEHDQQNEYYRALRVKQA